MASIFTYETEPPRVSSPWLSVAGSSAPSPSRSVGHKREASNALQPTLLKDYGVTKLQAEPQEGPTEYKLHLLLRPRRAYSSTSTGKAVAGSQQAGPNEPSPSSEGAISTTLPSQESRQNRLQQLTTQLLWRLQQSSPFHSSSTSDLVIPQFPETECENGAAVQPRKLVPGLEESQGALYEIGVSDNGTFVGLTQDELDESLRNLNAMAASLGCIVNVLRKVAVGQCEWLESDSERADDPLNRCATTRYHERLWVAEALVAPDLTSRVVSSTGAWENHEPRKRPPTGDHYVETGLSHIVPAQPLKQLRVTLTGPTTSGKSSLLGTLSTATLDNGRGKSRLSLLKHRHEMVSGITSSVAQELLGYSKPAVPGDPVKVINYASGNVTSWNDIHASADEGRLVFFSDSAGHPRYRRTTVRGLIGWAPHWTALCVAADDCERAPVTAGGTSTAQDVLGTTGTGVDLSKAHLELCLKLKKPLIIVITKLDLASMTGLRQTLAKLLSAIKAAGRTPVMLPPDRSKAVVDTDLGTISPTDEVAVQRVLGGMNPVDPKTVVPIIMTSALKGTGIRLMHALLNGLPTPPTPTSNDFNGPVLNPEQPSCLFHIEDTFAFSNPQWADDSGVGESLQFDGLVVAGHMRFGHLAIGSRVVVGPFPAYSEDSSPAAYQGPHSTSIQAKSDGDASCGLGTSLPYPSSLEVPDMTARKRTSTSVAAGEWHNFHIVSIRNLRFPTPRLEAGQVGTIGIVLDSPPSARPHADQPVASRIRKGMVLAIPSHHMIQTCHTLQAASVFTASFEDNDINSLTPGSLVVIYIASIRTSARVLRLSAHTSSADTTDSQKPHDDDIFGLSDMLDAEESDVPPSASGSDGRTDVVLELLTTREWIELGSQVLIMPGGGQGLYYGSERGEKGVAGLEGFVGRVIEIVE